MALQDIEGLTIANAPKYSNNNHWLNLLQIDSEIYGKDRDELMRWLNKNGIQTRPVWTLNYNQKPYRHNMSYKIEKAEQLATNSLCLPSSTNLSDTNIQYLLNQLIQ